ncbi:diiron oxygenase [Actinosynnema sp. NPDC059797]
MNSSLIFGKWYERAGVRTDPHRTFCAEVESGLTAFPLKLIPHLAHPLTEKLPEEERDAVVTRRFYEYMNFVANLEAKVVNRGTLVVAFDQAGLGIDRQLRLDAWKIYCDEAHHAHTSFDMVDQVERATGVPGLPYSFDHTLDRLDGSGRALHPQTAQLLQVVVFETVVTSLLEDIPNDETVAGTIREVVADHARDERRHHAFYTRFFDFLWGVMDEDTRARSARCLPGIITACLSPDIPAIRRSLLATSLTPGEVEQVIGETYTAASVQADLRASARHTLKMFYDHDVLEVPGAREDFATAGLLLPEEGGHRG